MGLGAPGFGGGRVQCCLFANCEGLAGVGWEAVHKRERRSRLLIILHFHSAETGKGEHTACKMSSYVSSDFSGEWYHKRFIQCLTLKAINIPVSKTRIEMPAGIIVSGVREDVSSVWSCSCSVRKLLP